MKSREQYLPSNIDYASTERYLSLSRSFGNKRAEALEQARIRRLRVTELVVGKISDLANQIFKGHLRLSS